MSRTAIICSAALTTLVLSGCATPSQRIASALTEAGVPTSNADCFGQQVAGELTVPELRRIAASVSQARQEGSALRLSDALRLAREAGDARTARILIEASLRCGG